MQDLNGSRVVIRDVTGYMEEGDFDGVERDEDGLCYVFLLNARQINHVDMTVSPPTVDAWDLPGRRRFAKHMVVEVGLTHLDGSVGPSAQTQGQPKRKAAKAKK